MNYYERHIGDYLKDTAHLSLLEHGVYGRLLDVYYTRESAIPDTQAARLIGARTKDELAAMRAVLDEFFTLDGGHWHQARCDAEIESFHGKQAEKGDTKEAAKERQRRARERRAQLFEALRSHGVTMPYKATTAELEAELSRITSQRVTRDESQGVTRDDTATQTPVPSHQTPESASHSAREPSPAAAVTMALNGRGILGNPSHPTLIALVEAGATPQEFLDAAPAAKGKSRPFEYLLSVVSGRRQEAANLAKGLHRGAMPQRQMTPSEVNSLAHGGFGTGLYGAFDPSQPPQQQPETVDVESRLIAP